MGLWTYVLGGLSRSSRMILANPRSIRPQSESLLPPSKRPEQSFQVVKVNGLLSPALNAYQHR
jgi:hypothetical protein